MAKLRAWIGGHMVGNITSDQGDTLKEQQLEVYLSADDPYCCMLMILDSSDSRASRLIAEDTFCLFGFVRSPSLEFGIWTY